jgi:hypothetical protein
MDTHNFIYLSEHTISTSFEVHCFLNFSVGRKQQKRWFFSDDSLCRCVFCLNLNDPPSVSFFTCSRSASTKVKKKTKENNSCFYAIVAPQQNKACTKKMSQVVCL